MRGRDGRARSVDDELRRSPSRPHRSWPRSHSAPSRPAAIVHVLSPVERRRHDGRAGGQARVVDPLPGDGKTAVADLGVGQPLVALVLDEQVERERVARCDRRRDKRPSPSAGCPVAEVDGPVVGVGSAASGVTEVDVRLSMRRRRRRRRGVGVGVGVGVGLGFAAAAAPSPVLGFVAADVVPTMKAAMRAMLRAAATAERGARERNTKCLLGTSPA